MTSLFMLSIPSKAAPGSSGEPETKLKTWIEQKIGVKHGVASIALPDLKVGLLDNLVRQADEVAKLDGQLQSILLKTHESIVSLYGDDAQKVSKVEQIDNQPASAYLQQFGWNTAKYRPDKAISDLLTTLSQEANSADMDLKARLATYNSVKQQVGAIDRKFQGDLSVRALDTVVRPADIVQDSEYLESVLVVVPLNQEKEFLAKYESISTMVVPRSAKKISGDKTFVLYSVTVFRKFASQFIHKVRENKWIPRDVPDACGSAHAQVVSTENTKKQDSELRAQEKKLRQEVEQLAGITYSDIVKTWGHVKVIRIFVESVLRYGLPPSYVTASFEPVMNSEKTEAKLTEQFAYLGGNAVSRDNQGRIQTSDSDMAEYASLVEQDYKPFVFYVANIP
ncbi:H(+)-transporting V1 sector ATPase subunit C [Starmerella bacillaris]|uniref:V-type proton ATPase subunit C n=1 Tax=Starmerella bacillaris TaxID=1247836 RepID=A0AAV5RLQ3_STABA|nr:H(+)-transporting V1 sector ATPase subunit C [Starmerella bacillaris]